MTTPGPPPPPPDPAAPPPGQPSQQPSNGLGLAAMIVGIAALPLLCCFGFGLLPGIVAVVLGFLGKQKADQGEATNRGQALAGMICGGVAVVLGLFGTILSFADVLTFGTF